MGYRRRTAFLTSVTVAQISEFSFIFVGLGVATNLVGSDILSITALVGVVTIALSAYLIIYNLQLYEWLSARGWLNWLDKLSDPGQDEPQMHASELFDHIIVVGMNTLGRKLVCDLTTRGETVLAIDTDPHKLQGLPGLMMIGNVEYLSVLEEAGLARAKMLVSALYIEDANDLLAYRCKQFKVPCAVNVVDVSVMDNLVDLDAAFLMVPKVDGVKAQVQKLREMGYLKA
jgi:hypothetical protein